MITPILKDPRKHGGTLYTFPSASRDLTRAFTNSEYEFSFSHFACLNLPDFRYGNFKEGDLKGVYLNNLHPYCIESVNNLNESLKWHLQSYVMNFEIAILNSFSLDSGNYDSEELRTPSERIFFNWLQKVGAIKFGVNSETLKGYGDEADIGYITLIGESDLVNADKTQMYRIGNKLYAWKGGEWRSRILVSNTVQYIGIIDMINNVNIDYDSFNEIYLNIPAGVGGSTQIRFNNIFDKNYENGEIIDVDIDDYCTDPEYIIGRNPEELNLTYDKTLKAIYDSTYDLSLTFINTLETPVNFNYDGGIYTLYGGHYSFNKDVLSSLKPECDIYINISHRGTGKDVLKDLYWDNKYTFDKVFSELKIDYPIDELAISIVRVLEPDEDSYFNDDYKKEYSNNVNSGLKSNYYLGHYLEHYYKIDSGYCIDFSDNNYSDGKGGVGIEKMNLSSEEDFEFNCILIYYKIRKGNGKWYTNLYGVLFLEEVSTSDYNINLNEDDERAGYIQRYPKFKKGNSWGLKLDLKIDAQPDSQMVLREKEYDDPNEGVDMQLFSEALVHLNDCTKLFYDVKKENTDIEERLYKLENIVSGVDTMYELRDDVGILRNKIEMIQPAINSLEGRMDDIESKISKIENNLGYLIGDIKTFEKGILNFENRVSDSLNEFSATLNDLNVVVSQLVENKVQISLMLNGDTTGTDLNKIIII
jgi:hypothetical protein